MADVVTEADERPNVGVPLATPVARRGLVPYPTRLRTWRDRRKRPPYVAFGALGLFVLVAAFAPLLAPHPPLEIDLGAALRPPFWADRGSADHLLGTDKLGRDVLSRMIFGTRPALIVATASVAIAAVFGSAVGIMAAYWGRSIDHALMRLVDIMLSFPAMLLALLLAARLGPGLSNVIVVISLILWASYARQVRGDAMVVMKKDYVALAQTGGRGAFGIMSRHVLPNVINTIIVVATLQLGIVIILEASLSFLNVGVPPPDPTWGGMITDGRGLIETAAWISVFPGVAILCLVLAVNVTGEWLEGYLDPRRRER
jgi:peptide/nickel transport system permease protein